MSSFYQLSRAERLAVLQKECNLSAEDLAILSGHKPLPDLVLDYSIENSIGYFPMPLGVAVHFVIDGKKCWIPMAVEETSIIASASATAKWIAHLGGQINTWAEGRWIIGQIQCPRVHNFEQAASILQQRQPELIQLANAVVPGLVQRGGGVQQVQLRKISLPEKGVMLVIHLLCDPKDVMGANLISQICEALRPVIEEWIQEPVGLCILSNLVDQKRVSAQVRLPGVDSELGLRIQSASEFAEVDPYRAATHNKGVLNGIDPILIATGNDWRAVEAGVHAYASLQGRYQSVTSWKWEQGVLTGEIQIPLAVGICGGMTRLHPTARVALKILQVDSAEGLARICAAVGLVQNLGALKALTTVGIVASHMKLHLSNLALAAGAQTSVEVQAVVTALKDVLDQQGRVQLHHAQHALVGWRKQQESDKE